MSLNAFRKFVSLAAACLIACVAAAQSLVVCPACSHESTGGNFCQHCGASLAKGAEATVAKPADAPLAAESAPAAPAEVAPAADPAARLVREDLRRAAAANVATPEGATLALAALSNAKAVFAAFPSSGVSEDERRRIHVGIAAARTTLATARVVCPRCDGKGLEDDVRELAALDGKSVTMKAGRITCKRCRGARTIVKIRPVSELRSLVAAGRQRFAEVSLLAARVKNGNAWIAPEMDASATAKRQALLRRNSADPCPECAGYGRRGCDDCDGTGTVVCTSAGCRDGRVESKPEPRAAGPGRIAPAAGTRFTPCPDCKGNGEVACKTCGGTGADACSACKGSGERKPCTSCHAEGTAACRTCKGTGKDKKGQDCLVCGAQGIVICTSCGGDGYGR